MSEKKWTPAELPSLDGRTVVITGSNSGIGFDAAKALARAGARVTLAVRNTTKGEEAASKIDGETDVRPLDLADQASVRAFADDWSGDIDLLINNAGVMAMPERYATADGFEMQFGTNHLGHFALTNLLLPNVRDRVVNLASGAHRFGSMDFDDLNWNRRSYKSWGAYGQSKLANLLFTAELQRRLDEAGSPVITTAAHPGYAATNLQSHGGRLTNAILWIGNQTVAQSPERGSWPTLFAATADIPGNSYAGPDGFQEVRGHPHLVGRSGRAANADDARRLWDISEELTGVKFPKLARQPVVG